MKSQKFKSYYKTPGKLVPNFTSTTDLEDCVSYVTPTDLIKSELFSSHNDAAIHII